MEQDLFFAEEQIHVLVGDVAELAANSYTAVAERLAFVVAVAVEGDYLAGIASVADTTALVAAGTVASLVSDVERTRTALALALVLDAEKVEIGAEAVHFDLAVDEEEEGQLLPAWQYLHLLEQGSCTFYI